MFDDLKGIIQMWSEALLLLSVIIKRIDVTKSLLDRTQYVIQIHGVSLLFKSAQEPSLLAKL